VKLNSSHFNSGLPKRRRAAFTLVEVLVSMAILIIIILGMMEVFTHTQTAFRANLTQTDVLESGRDVMDLIKSDLEGMTPSDGYGIINGVGSPNTWAVNFYVAVTNYPSLSPFSQSLVGSTTNRANVLENFFILSRQNVNGNDCWIGTGYVVIASLSNGSLSNSYSLYRFTTSPPYPVMSRGPEYAFYNYFVTNNFTEFLRAPANYSHLMDGVVDLRIRAFNSQGAWIDLNTNNIFATNYDAVGDIGLYSFYSNAIPASVEVEMGVLEDRTLQHAEGLNGTAVTNYLADHAGQVHIFRQRIPIRNVDPTAYQ